MKIRPRFGQGDFSRKLTNLTNFVARVYSRIYITLYNNLERRKTATCLIQQSSQGANFYLNVFSFHCRVFANYRAAKF